jgi:hypothetical protein
MVISPTYPPGRRPSLFGRPVPFPPHAFAGIMEQPPHPTPSTKVVILSAIFFEGGMALVAILLGYLFSFPLGKLINWNGLDLLWGALATIPLLGLFLFSLTSRWKPLRSIRRTMHRVILESMKHCSVLQILMICLLAGFGEELLFRGLIQEGLAAWIGGQAGDWIGLFVGAIAFGLLHPISLTYILLVVIVGLYLGALMLYFDNLLVPIVVHTWYDFVAIRTLIRLHQRRKNR